MQAPQLAGGIELRKAALAVCAVAFATVFAARLAVPGPEQAIGFLYVVPIAVLAAELGVRAGLVGAAIALLLTAVWSEVRDVGVDAFGYAALAAGFVLVGSLIGYLETHRRTLEEQNTRWFEMSNDLVGEASFDGHFTRLNEAWAHKLGYSKEELRARPYIDLVHPDDRERTLAAASSLAERPGDIVGFENRYRAKDGSWRWLLWSARSDRNRIYAVAKDITERKTLEGERLQLLAKVSTIARTDDLTGLPNRRSLEEELGREVARAARTGRQLAVVMLDIDHFKRFNDEHGHQAGDELLKRAAAAWRSTLRVTDFIARYGGEEFTIMFPETSCESAVHAVERLRAKTPMGQTCSAGIALWEPTEPAEAVVRRADSALYEAKRAGRDRVIVSSASGAVFADLPR